MRVLVISDSHGKNDDVKQVIQQVGEVDMMIHLGDIERGDEYIRSIAMCDSSQVYMVMGNNDYNLELPQQQEIIIAGKRVFITHGHRFYVNGGVDRLRQFGLDNQYDIVMYGHTHVPFLSIEDNITILNPGSLSYPRQDDRKQTYTLIDIDDNGEFHYSQGVMKSFLKELYKKFY